MSSNIRCAVLRFLIILLFLAAAPVVSVSCAASGIDVRPSAPGIEPIRLPPPELQGGMPLMEALKIRKSSRSFSKERLPPQVLSNLLWAAFGVNRPETGGRTAPSAMNWQEIDIYAAMQEGLYRYNASGNLLEPVLAKDIRSQTGGFGQSAVGQSFVKHVPVNLIYVADFSRTGVTGKVVSPEAKLIYAAASTGCISQNVYLFCASAGLATVVRGYFNPTELAKEMGLADNQRIILVQPVGYPKK